MEVELFFSDLSSMGGPDKWQSQAASDFEGKAVFKSVSVQRFILHRLPQGISEFVSITFED
jgi:Protein FAM135